MNIHEYQAKSLLRGFGVSVPDGRLLEGSSAAKEKLSENAEKLAQDLAKHKGNKAWVIKAQVHAGGRGKAGGVKLCKTLPEVRAAAAEIMGKKLITPQTGAQGKVVHKIWIEEASEIARELYLGLLVDRKLGMPVFMVSTEGGMDIEEVAHKTPEKILKLPVDPLLGLRSYHCRKMAEFLKLAPEQVKQAQGFFKGIYECFLQKDCSLIEINPLIVTQAGEVKALDAKVNFEDNALFRHPHNQELRDILEENPQDVEAAKYDLNYIALSGSIGCMVNGAGLAMATMDLLKLNGGSPANFLDVGGGASREKVTQAFKIILQDTQVKAVLVNIFGGIMKCDVIAEGIVAAAQELKITVPLVVRLEGTNVERGKQILSESGLKIIAAGSFSDAAVKAIEAAHGHLVK